MSANGRPTQLLDLQNRVEQLSTRVGELRRPFVIEFTGTPKSGKTTCVDTIAKFFRRNGVPVYLVTERASVCPIRDKNDIRFNLWTLSTSLAQLIEAIDKPRRVVILDRGLFDSLVWMNYHKKGERLSQSAFRTIEAFLTLRVLAAPVDIVAALRVDPSVALEREFKDQITDREGSIMNARVLGQYNDALTEGIKKYQGTFREIVEVDTSLLDAKQGVTQIAGTLLRTAESLLDEQIAVVPTTDLQNLMGSKELVKVRSGVKDAFQAIRARTTWPRRSTAEDDPSVVQLLPILVIRRKNKREVLLIEHRGGKHGSMENRKTVWLGGHCRDEDQGHRGSDFLRAALVREISEELKLDLDTHRVAGPTVLVWDRSVDRSARHLAIVFEYPWIADEGALHEREFPEITNKSVFTRFVSVDDLKTVFNELEFWSQAYLRYLFDENFEGTTTQLKLAR